MPELNKDLVYPEESYRIVGSAMKVHRELGWGFLEKVYEKALAIELRLDAMRVEEQKVLNVQYKGAIVGEYKADLIVDEIILLELKTRPTISVDDDPQVLNYLRATGLKLGILLNFGKDKLEFKRLVL